MKQFLKNKIDGIWKPTDNFSYEIISSREEKPFANEQPHFIEDAINISYANDNTKWFHREYIKKLKKPIIIEPEYSYCITDFNKIISSSVFFPKLLPSFPNYVLALFRPKEKIQTAILFDGQVGTNYFHFFSDILSKIWLFKHIPNSGQLPIIIGHKTYATPYFQYLLQHSDLGKYNWVVQKQGQYIQTQELYLLRPMPYEKSYFTKIKLLLNLPGVPAANRRVFLTRSKKAGRYLDNFEAIETILKRYNFEVIDTDGKTLDAQAHLFHSAEYLISLHGAGLTNIIFSNSNLRFLEINAANRISCQYYWLSKTLGIPYYDVVLGENLTDPKKGFSLNPEKFEDAVKRLLDPTPRDW
ncbi:MAG: glycosyltransferase family 61 protein [Chitinophagales bacterium]|nr:glycosyltransferase family 61 protein [Chitinophagales bacterium]